MIDTAVLRKLLAETTQGEWKAYEFFVSAGDSDIFEYPSGSFTPFPENAAFTAAAHTAMPALLDELDRLRAFVARNGENYSYDGIDANYISCNGCAAPSVKRGALRDDRPVRLKHAPGCIVAEARAAQKEARE